MTKYVRLGDICLIKSAKRIFESEYVDEGIPFIRGQEISDGSIGKVNAQYECRISVERYNELKKTYGVPQYGDILITAVGTIGNLYYVNTDSPFYYKDGNIIQFTKFFPTVYSKYLFYVMKSPYFTKQIECSLIGAVQKALTMVMLSEIKIPLPLVAEQIEIATILSAIDDKISNNAMVEEELESLAKTLYDYWFTQFDFPDENGKPYRSSGGAMEWNEQLKCEIPKGWKISSVSEFIGSYKGGDWGKESLEGNYSKEVCCIRGADFPAIAGRRPLYAPTRYILSKNADKCLVSGDIIVEISGGSPTQSTGRVCYINDYTLRRFEKDIITSNFCKAFSTKERHQQYWLYMLWKSAYDAGVLFGYEGKTTGIKNLLFDVFCTQHKIVAPDDKVMKCFHKMVSPIFDKIQQCNIQNDELTKLRDWLLPMLMNGQATVLDEEATARVIEFKNSEPEQYEVRQAARSYGKVVADDTSDLVKEFLKRRNNDA